MSLTPEYILDTVEKELIKQGGPSANEAGMCLYRSPEGRKCGVGVLIPDELYTPDFDDEDLDFAGTISNIFAYGVSEYSENEVVTECTRLLDYLGKDNLDLLSDVQELHDSWVRGPRVGTSPRAPWAEYITNGINKLRKGYLND